MSILRLAPFFTPVIYTAIKDNAVHWQYSTRGFFRISGESLHLSPVVPQAVPNSRKMDYAFRDFWLTTLNAFITEFTYRAATSVFVIKAMAKELGLETLPKDLRKYLIGTGVQARSYSSVPDLLADQALEIKTKDPERAKQLLKFESILRDIFQPNHYIEQAVKTDLRQMAPALSDEAAKKLEETAKKVYAEFKSSVCDVLKDPTSANESKIKLFEEYLAKLSHTPGINSPTLANLVGKKGQFRQSVGFYNWPNLFFDFLFSPFDLFKKQKRQDAFLKKLAYDKYQQSAWSHFLWNPLDFLRTEKRQEIFKTKIGAPNPLVESSFFGKEGIEWFKTLWSSGFDFGKAHQEFIQTKPFVRAENLRLEALKPWLEEEALKGINGVFKAEQSVAKKLASYVLKASELHLKDLRIKRLSQISGVPGIVAGLVGSALFMGQFGTWFDTQYIMPLEREVVKLRGDSKEFSTATYMGIAASLVALFGTLAMPPVRKLGYFTSFAIATGASLLAAVAGTFYSFQWLLLQPRVIKVDAKTWAEEQAKEKGVKAQTEPKKQAPVPPLPIQTWPGANFTSNPWGVPQTPYYGYTG